MRLTDKSFTFAPTLACRLLGATALAASTLAMAQPSGTSQRVSDTVLEQRFWDCDARATLELLSLEDGVQCTTWLDELKERRFGGDFGEFLVWWQEHKAEQHAQRLGLAVAQQPEP